MYSSSLDAKLLLQAFDKPSGKVAVVGNRDFQRWEWVLNLVGLIPPGWTLLSRGCAGVDTWVEQFAETANLVFEARRPDWQQYHRMAPVARNRELVAEVDWLIVFWDGASNSLNDLVARARKQNKLLHIFIDDGS